MRPTDNTAAMCTQKLERFQEDVCRAAEQKYYFFDPRITASVERAVLEFGDREKSITRATWDDQYKRTSDSLIPDWEHRVSILYPHVEYNAEKGRYQMWYEAFYTASPVAGYDWRDNLIDAQNSRGVELGGFRNTARGSIFPGKDVLCYMESVDGESWTRPELGEFFYRKQNGEIIGTNIVFVGLHGNGVERNEHSDPREPKYLMAGRAWETDSFRGTDPVGVAVSWSDDGIHWEKPITVKTAYECSPDIWYIRADTHNQLKYLPERGRYAVITRGYASRNHSLRQVAVMEAADSLHSLYELEADRASGGEFYWRETTKRWCDPEVTLDGGLSLSAQPYSMPSVHAAEGYYVGVVSVANFDRGSSDWGHVYVGLTWSPDGKSWQHIRQGDPFIRNAEQFSYTHGNDYGMIYCAAPVVVGDKVEIFYAALPELHYVNYGQIPEEIKAVVDLASPIAADKKAITRTTALKKLTLGRDRYAGYRAEDGVVLTVPFRVTGGNLKLTADVWEGGSLKIAVLDECGAEIPGYGADDFCAVRITQTEQPVRWGTRGLADLRGRTVAFRIHLLDAAVYTLTGSIEADELLWPGE